MPYDTSPESRLTIGGWNRVGRAGLLGDAPRSSSYTKAGIASGEGTNPMAAVSSALDSFDNDRSVKLALVHDYLTQRGGAERVALAMARAFPGAPLHTTMYEPDRTFPGFAAVDVRTTPLQRAPMLRRSHDWSLPLLPAAVGSIDVG